MGIIGTIRALLTGGGARGVKEIIEVVRPNAEASEQRGHNLDVATLNQLAAEFGARNNRGWFDQMMDGLNRLPRPMMVISCFGLLAWTAMDPLKMAEVFSAWALIPAGMWGIITTIVVFYFGGRSQAKDHDFQRELAASVALAPSVVQNIAQIRELGSDSPGVADTGTDTALAETATQPSDNAAIDEALNPSRGA